MEGGWEDSATWLVSSTIIYRCSSLLWIWFDFLLEQAGLKNRGYRLVKPFTFGTCMTIRSKLWSPKFSILRINHLRIQITLSHNTQSECHVLSYHLQTSDGRDLLYLSLSCQKQRRAIHHQRLESTRFLWGGWSVFFFRIASTSPTESILTLITEHTPSSSDQQDGNLFLLNLAFAVTVAVISICVLLFSVCVTPERDYDSNLLIYGRFTAAGWLTWRRCSVNRPHRCVFRDWCVAWFDSSVLLAWLHLMMALMFPTRWALNLSVWYRLCCDNVLHVPSLYFTD